MMDQAVTEVDLWFGTSGPHDARVVIVGEAWGFEEAAATLPFVGASGSELTRILTDAGIDRSECLLTNVFASRPPANEFWRLFDGTMEIRGLYPSDSVVS
jgi:uracil-DNA glycosylase family 4